jgi:hypothetical protein
MKKSSVYVLCLALLSSSIASEPWYRKLSLQVSNLFKFGKHETVIEKEYKFEKPGMLTVHNADGNISITTEWNRKEIRMKAIKRASREENLEALSIKAKHKKYPDGDRLLISSAANNNIDGTIDYQFIVPANIKLNLHTETGNIQVHDVKGPVVAKAVNGNIELGKIAHGVSAQTEETGSISIEKVQDNIKAVTNKGHITIHDAKKCVVASTQKGNINAICNNISEKSKINLHSESTGAITLAMPSSANATVMGKTEHGRLTSDLDITMKPFTTKLNRQARRDLERSVNGILGAGGAEIQLSSNSGNIRIIETEAA